MSVESIVFKLLEFIAPIASYKSRMSRLIEAKAAITDPITRSLCTVAIDEMFIKTITGMSITRQECEKMVPLIDSGFATQNEICYAWKYRDANCNPTEYTISKYGISKYDTFKKHFNVTFCVGIILLCVYIGAQILAYSTKSNNHIFITIINLLFLSPLICYFHLLIYTLLNKRLMYAHELHIRYKSYSENKVKREP